MTALLTVLLFGTAFAVSIWSLVNSVRPQLHRYRALFAPAAPAPLVLAPTRVTVRWSSPAPRRAEPRRVREAA